MSDALRVTLVQADLAWEDAAANRRQLERLLEPHEGRSDLVVLPEMFATGFSMSPEKVAEPMNGPSFEWMRNTAGRLGAVLAGSLAIEEGGRYFNRFIWMRPDGSYETYDKRHLFRLAGEDASYEPGEAKLIVQLGAWRVCPMVCYDLRFPVWSRNLFGTDSAYEVLLYVANWPAPRHNAWQTLLRARAIENLSYCIGVNRVGTDGKGLRYRGGSVAIDFLGRELTPESEEQGVATATLDLAALEEFRRKFPFHVDADEFTLGRMGSPRARG
ncbi:MAG TPA: amidohydrolase [Steroidobacteraceae bacterium]